MKIIVLILGIILNLFIFQARGIEISSMFEVMDKGKASFSVKNIDKHRIYLHIGMNELTIVDGQIIKTPYTRDNIADWEIMVRPAKMIIEPGFEKKINVTYQCKKNCEAVTDKIFQLAVVPTPYFPEGQPENNAVQVAVGFAPIVAMVKQDVAPKEYAINYHGETIEFTNFGSSLFNVIMQSCDDIQKCQAQANILAGRNLHYRLPEGMQKQKLTLKISSALGKHEKVHVLNVNEVYPK